MTDMYNFHYVVLWWKIFNPQPIYVVTAFLLHYIMWEANLKLAAVFTFKIHFIPDSLSCKSTKVTQPMIQR